MEHYNLKYGNSNKYIRGRINRQNYNLTNKKRKNNKFRKSKKSILRIGIIRKSLNSFEKSKINELENLMIKLKKINQKLWVIEDDIRLLEKNKKFDNNFIELARSVYITNDERFEIKNKINRLFSSDIEEVKSYEEY